jgi:hypothetical protein
MTVSRQLIASEARFVKRTINVDGNLDDWKGVTPVLLDSEALDQSVDLTQYLLNPHLDTPTTQPGGKRIVARVYTAYDKDNVYLAMAVDQDTYSAEEIGEPVKRGRGKEKVELPYKTGMPDGIGYVTLGHDVFQFAFGFRDRVPTQGRQMNDPYAWKGMFYDTDYSFVAHGSANGDQLLQTWGADTSRRNGYQTEAVPGIGPVPGGKIKIVRDEAKKITTYELSIPRKELALFNPDAGQCRFGFILANKEGLGGGSGLMWSEAAGVFDHWRSSGSFPPTWMQRLPCQTFFGIEK